MANIGTIVGTIQLKDAFSSPLKAASVAVAGFAALSVKKFAEFDQAITESTAIMGDISADLRAEMVKTARTVAKELVPSAKEAAESYFFLASAGLDAKQSIAALPLVAKFAQAGTFDMARATDLLTDAQSALGLTIRDDVVKNMENMVRVSDVLVRANVLANATVEQFSTALTTEAGAALKSFNIDVEEGVAVLAAFADQGVKSEVAGTGLSRILRLMTSAAVNNKEAYKKLHVEIFDSAGQIRNLADIVENLEQALGGLSDEERVAALEMLGFQARVQGVILPLLGTSAAIRRYEAELRNAGGYTEDVANRQLQSFSNQLGLVKDRLIDVAMTMGEQIAPAIAQLAKDLATAAESEDFRQLAKDIGTALVTALRILGGAIKVVHENASLIKGVLAGLIALKIELWLAKVILSLAAYTGTTAAAAGTTSALAGAQARAVGPAAAFIAANARAIPILGAQGQVLSVVTQQTIALGNAQVVAGGKAAGAAISTGSLTTAFRGAGIAAKGFAASLGPVGIALIAASALYVGISSRLKEISAQMQSDINEMVNSSRVLGTELERMQRVRWSFGIDPAELEKAVEATTAALRLAKESGDQQQLWAANRAYKEATDALAKYKAALLSRDDLAQVEEDWAAVDESLKKHREELMRLRKEAGGAFTVDPEDYSPEMKDLARLIADEEVRVKVLGLTILHTKELAAETSLLGEELEGLPPFVPEGEMAAFRAEVEASMKALRGVAEGWSISTAAGRESVRVAELEASILERTAKLKGAELAIAQQMLRVEDELRRTAAGAEKLATLTEEKTILEGQLRALEEGVVAADEAAAAWEQWKRQIEATTDVAEDQKDAISAAAEEVAALQRRLEVRKENQSMLLELKQLKALQEEYARGPAAVAKLRKAQELENAVRHGTIGLVGLERAARATLIVMMERQKAASGALAGDQDRLNEMAGMQRLLDVYERGAATVQDLEEALRQANLETEIQNQLWSETVDRASPRGQKIVALATAYSELSAKLAKARQDAEDVAIDFKQIGKNFLEGVQDSLAGFFRSVLNGSGNALENFGKSLKDLLFNVLAEYLAKWVILQAKMLAASLKRIAAEKAAQQAANTGGGGGGGGGAGGLGSLFGGGGGGGGGGAWSSIAAWGAVIAIVGAIGYSQGWWGSKGREARGSVTLGPDLEVEDAWGQNAKVILPKVREAVKEILAFVKDVGLAIESFGSVTVEKRWKTYYVNGINMAGKTAEEIQDAIATLAIRTAEFGASVSAFVQAVIRGSTAITTETLKAEIEMARQIEGFGHTDFEQSVAGIGRRFSEMFAFIARQLADDLEQATVGFSQIVLGEAEEWRAAWRELTGVQLTPEQQLEIMKSNARVFEAEKALRLAELRARVQFLEAEKRITETRARIGLEDLRAQTRIEAGRRRAALAEMRFGGAYLGARASLYQAEEDLAVGHFGIMGQIVGAAASILDAEIAALNELIAALEAIPTINIDDLRLPGGGGGGRRQQQRDDREQLRGILDAFDLSQLSETARALAEINLRRDEGIRLAHGDADLLKLVNLMREREIDLLRQQLRAEVEPFLPAPTFFVDSGAGFTSTSIGEWGVRAQEIIAWADRIAEENRILLQETGQAALSAEEIASATANRMAMLAEEAIDSLGLPSEQLRDSFRVLGETLRFLQQQVDAGTLSQERYAAAVAELAQQQFLALGDALFGFLDRYYGDVEGFEEFRRQLEQARFELELANLRLQFELLMGLGLLTEETIALVQGVLDFIAQNEPTLPNLPVAGGNVIQGNFGGSAISDLERERERAAQEIRDIIRSALPAYDRDVLELTERFDEYRRLLGNTADVQRAWNIAFGQLNDRYTSSLRDFLETLRDPALSQQQQFEAVRQRFLELAATGDIGNSEDLLRLAQQLRDLGADYFGTAGGGFQGLLDLIESQINAFLGPGGAIAAAGSSASAISALGLPPAGAGTGPLGIVPSVPVVSPTVASSIRAPGVEQRLDRLIAATERGVEYARVDTRGVAAGVAAVASQMNRRRMASVRLG